MFESSRFYEPSDVAAAINVAVGSVYQSIPGKTCRVKLGKPLPEPLRLGRLIRWTGRQLNEWAGIPQPTQSPEAEPQPAPVPAGAAGAAPDVDPAPALVVNGRPARPRGRPRKVAAKSQSTGGATA